MPKTLALMAVQRQTAASASMRPWMRGQQGLLGGVPMVRSSKPFRTFAQTPNLRASMGQVPEDEVEPPVEGEPEYPGVGLGLGLGFGLGFGLVPLPHSPHAETSETKKRFRTRKSARDLNSFEAMLGALVVRSIRVFKELKMKRK